MTDPRDLLGAAGDDVPPVDLAAVHARAGHLRRRRTAAVTVVGALVLVATAGVALGIERTPDDEQLQPPVASAPASTSPRPSSSPAGSPTASPPSPSGSSPSPSPAPPRSPSSTPSAPRTSAPATSPPSPPASPPVLTSPPPTSPASPFVPFPADDGPEASPGTGSGLVVSSVTTGPQDGYDRTVFTFAAAPAGVVPGWRVQYVDQAVQDGSGAPIALAGSSVLQVVLTGTANEASPATGRTAPRGTVLLREVYLGSSFEGQAGAFLGLDARAPFRVFALSAPTRVVVDVRTR